VGTSLDTEQNIHLGWLIGAAKDVTRGIKVMCDSDGGLRR
jgi:hypothetical protein